MTSIFNFFNWLTLPDLLLFLTTSVLIFFAGKPLSDGLRLHLTWLTFGFFLLLKFVTGISLAAIVISGFTKIPFFIFWSSWVVSVFYFGLTHGHGKYLRSFKHSLAIFFTLIIVFTSAFLIF